MGRLSRQFLSLIVDNRIAGAQSLRCIDLTRHALFNTPPPIGKKNKKQAAAVDTSKMQKISLPKPSFHMRSSGFDADDYRMNCFPAIERRVICLDKLGRGFLLEADTSQMVMLPPLHKPKLDPISLYIPCYQDLYDLHGDGGGGGTLFVMDRVTNPAEIEAAGCQSFEAIVYRRSTSNNNFLCKSWDCDILPSPPPYAGGDASHGGRLEIISYAVVNGGARICVSVAGAGTYCMDTASYAWSEVGKWTLPFQGKVEYVPELRLWFGFSAEDRLLVAADLSAINSGESQQPQLLGDCWKWKGLELDLPREWQQVQDPQLVCLGSGRFCIARFLRTGSSKGGAIASESSQQNVTVLTGVEVATAYDFGYKLCVELVRHRTRCYMSSCGEDTITAVF